MEKIGLIAGNGRFPIIFAQKAAEQGLTVVAVAHRGETLPELETVVTKSGGQIIWLHVGQLGRLIKAFKSAGVGEVVMAGGIKKTRLFSDVRPDLRSLKLLRQVGQNKDDVLLRAVARELEDEGLTVRESTLYLSSILASKGPMTRRVPTSEEWKDIQFGWQVAKEVGRLEIGQCIVVKRQVVLAVEAIEGTDETIKRGGRLCRSGAVVVKVSKPQQDLRFDVPAVGPSTVEAMKEVKASILAVEAGKTLLLDKEMVLEMANREKISIMGMESEWLGSK
jgi:DUF1009 family protein